MKAGQAGKPAVALAGLASKTVSRPAGWGTAAGAVVAGLMALAGCGNTYRPVVSAINPVGPAGQPQKYAVAVSSPSQTPVSGPTAFVGVYAAGTSYSINQAVSYNGAEYVSLVNGNIGHTPNTSPTYWVGLTNGLVTIVDFSGDTVLITATLGLNPYYFALNAAGTTGYTLNSDSTVNSFDVSNQLLSSQVLETTLLPGSAPVNIFTTSTTTYLADPGLNQIDQLTGTPPALKQELPVGTNPVWLAGQNGSPRVYAISQGAGTGAGTASAIETAANTVSATLPVGRGPVFGLMTTDDRRTFVLNKTDGTVSVINAVSNALDTAVPNITVGSAPVWADVVPTRNELVVLNQGSGTNNGSLSILDVSLCSASALPTNPNCDATNPVDASSFGTVYQTVPVGINPIMVAALADGTRAYVANAGVRSLPCAANGVAVPGVSTTCTISVVNLTTNTVTATIPIAGHPAWIAATTGTPTGKIYVVCNDSQVMTVIETDTDTIDTTIPLQGYGVSVRMTAQ